MSKVDCLRRLKSQTCVLLVYRFVFLCAFVEDEDVLTSMVNFLRKTWHP